MNFTISLFNIPFMCYAKNGFKLNEKYSKLDCRFSQGKIILVPSEIKSAGTDTN